MKPFRERNTRIIGAVGLVVILIAVGVALDFKNLPFSSQRTFHAQLADAGQLTSGEPVDIRGVKVGTVSGLKLQGDHVLLTFKVGSSAHFGPATTLDVKTLSPLGQEYVQLVPSGPGQMKTGSTILIGATKGSPTIVSTVSQLGGEVGSIDQQQLAKALQSVDQDVSTVAPSATAAAISGLGNLSQIVADRQDQLSQLLTQAQAVTATLTAHQQPLVTLIGQSTLILQVLQQRQADISSLLGSVTDLSQRVQSILTDPSANLSALLTNLKTVSSVLASDSGTLANTIPTLAGFSRYLANATGNGPYFDAIAPLLFATDSVIAQCAPPGVTPPTNVLTSTGCNVLSGGDKYP